MERLKNFDSALFMTSKPSSCQANRAAGSLACVARSVKDAEVTTGWELDTKKESFDVAGDDGGLAGKIEKFGGTGELPRIGAISNVESRFSTRVDQDWRHESILGDSKYVPRDDIHLLPFG